jgi:phenylacetate-coenzyme A ligase PaaK-like adenylate-forming protein
MGWHRIFEIDSTDDFDRLALETFRHQYETVPVYRKFCQLLRTNIEAVRHLEQIPFLPVEFFKSHRIISGQQQVQAIFESSGTTASIPSKHYVTDLQLYQKSFTEAFRKLVGAPEEMVILALLPSYLERQGSSLVYMADRLIELTNNQLSGFYLDRYDKLIATLETCEANRQPTLLLGVTFALLELAEKHPLKLEYTTIMETGGMKGRRKELVREEVHSKLISAFKVGQVYSEYGMTELLSQAYSRGGGRFTTPPWMKVLTRDTDDPLGYVHGRTGGINVIDLANQYSCSFIATQDLGKTHPDGSFEVLGRFDHSDIRGCNLMAL